MNIKLTVLFEEPFWVGVFERYDGEYLQTSRTVFGAEPKDYEVYAFVLNNYYKLLFGKPVEACEKDVTRISPKRLQRQIKKQTKETGLGTKAQRAIQESLEARKIEGNKLRKEDRERQEEIKFILKQEKKKEKKRGH